MNGHLYENPLKFLKKMKKLVNNSGSCWESKLLKVLITGKKSL